MRKGAWEGGRRGKGKDRQFSNKVCIHVIDHQTINKKKFYMCFDMLKYQRLVNEKTMLAKLHVQRKELYTHAHTHISIWCCTENLQTFTRNLSGTLKKSRKF